MTILLSKEAEKHVYYRESNPDIIIMLGDCQKIMPLLPKIDLCVTDPPYGIKRDKGFEGFGGFGEKIARRRYEEDDWDSERPKKEVFDRILNLCRLALIFGGNYFADILPISTHWIVWDKLNTMPTFGDCELIWTNSERKSVKKVTREYNGLIGKEESRQHPTQKPMNVLYQLVRDYSQGSVLDPFLGSGTTLVACKELNRAGIGIEISEKYCEISKKRLLATCRPLFKETVSIQKREEKSLF